MRVSLGIGLILVLLLSVGGYIFTKGAGAGPPAPEGAVVLRAGDNDGRDPPWARRHYYNQATWGIRGSGKVESGEIWFDSFPGASGRYNIQMGIIAEQDGASPYAIYAGDRLLVEGRFPLPQGRIDCDARGIVTTIDLGEHQIHHGEKIRVWGESVYDCGDQGAYTLWHSLIFSPAAEQ